MKRKEKKKPEIPKVIIKLEIRWLTRVQVRKTVHVKFTAVYKNCDKILPTFSRNSLTLNGILCYIKHSVRDHAVFLFILVRPEDWKRKRLNKQSGNNNNNSKKNKFVQYVFEFGGGLFEIKQQQFTQRVRVVCWFSRRRSQTLLSWPTTTSSMEKKINAIKTNRKATEHTHTWAHSQ